MSVPDVKSIAAANPAESSSASTSTSAPASAPAPAPAPAASPARFRDLIGSFLNLLIAVLLFLCGWMWGTQLNIGQMRMIEESAAQRFAVRKVYKAGFEDAMKALIGHQLRVREAVGQLRSLPPTTDEAQLAKQKEAWGELAQALDVESLATQQLLFEHGLEQHEKEAIAQMIAADAGAKDHLPSNPPSRPQPQADSTQPPPTTIKPKPNATASPSTP